MDCRAEGEGSPSVTGSIDGEACLLFSLFSSLLSQLLLSSWKRARWLSWTVDRPSSASALAVWRRQPLSAHARLLPISPISSDSLCCSSHRSPFLSPASPDKIFVSVLRQAVSPITGSSPALGRCVFRHSRSTCLLLVLTNERRRCELHCMEACFTITFGTKRPCIPTRDVICAPVRVRRSERIQEQPCFFRPGIERATETRLKHGDGHYRSIHKPLNCCAN